MSDEVKVKPHISPSSLDLFLKSPCRWKKEKLDGQRPLPSLAMTIGNAVHAAAKQNFSFKRTTGDDVDLEWLEDGAVYYLSEVASTTGLQYDKEEFGDDAAAALDGATRVIRGLVRLFRSQIAPEYNPNLIEHRFRIPMDGCDHDLLGVIDLAESERNLAVDLKTAGKKWSQSDADSATQPTFYDIAWRCLTGVDEHPEFRFEVLTKTKFERQTVRTYRDKRSVWALIYRVRAMSKMIKAGVFPPAPAAAWWCSEKCCPHWGGCEYVAPVVTGIKIPLRIETGVTIDSPIDAEPLDVGALLHFDGIRQIERSVRDILFDKHPRCARCNSTLTHKTAVLQSVDDLQMLTIDNAKLVCPVCAIRFTLSEEF